MPEPKTKIEENMCDEATRKVAHTLYENYIANSDGLNFQGNACPTWEDLPAAIRGHWCRVALSMHNACWDAWHHSSEIVRERRSDGRARYEEAEDFKTWWRGRS